MVRLRFAAFWMLFLACPPCCFALPFWLVSVYLSSAGTWVPQLAKTRKEEKGIHFLGELCLEKRGRYFRSAPTRLPFFFCFPHGRINHYPFWEYSLGHLDFSDFLFFLFIFFFVGGDLREATWGQAAWQYVLRVPCGWF